MSGTLEMRRAVASDAAEVRDLTRQAYAKWVPLIGREPKPMTANYEEAVRRHRIDLLHLEGTLAALIETIPEADHLLVENVAVSPSFQGRGLGRNLMAHAEQLAAAAGYRQSGSTPTNSSPRTSRSIEGSATGSTGKRCSPTASPPT